MSAPTIRPYQYGQIYDTRYSNRADEIRRDNDTVKIPKVTLYDIDYSIYYHLAFNLKLKVSNNDNIIDVPVKFADSEKWNQIRRDGFIRDKDGKINLPLILIRRMDVMDDERISMPPGQTFGGTSTFYPSSRIIPMVNTGMQFDRLAGQYLTKRSREFYIVTMPSYIRLTYELVIMTDLQEQMNVLVQGIIPLSDHVWGDYWKFRTNVQDITHDNVNAPGEDRLVKSTITLQVDGYLRNEFEYRVSKIMKAYSIKKVNAIEEDQEKIIFEQTQDLISPNLPSPPIQDINLSEDGRTLRKPIRNNNL